MGFYFIVQYSSGGNLKLIVDIKTGQVKRFNSRREARKYCIQNCIGIFQVYEFYE